MNRKKRMSRKKLTIVSLVAIPAVAGLGFAVTGPAFAGTNGQQLQFCQSQTDYLFATVQGMNQNGESQRQRVELGPTCRNYRDFWWKGTVTIDWESPITAGIPSATTTCNVLEDQKPDLFTCFAPHP